MEREAFVRRFGAVYEHSAWIAEQAFERGLGPETDHPSGLAKLMGEVLAAAGRDAKLALIRAHPDLAGRAAIAGELTAESRGEQAGAGLDRCSPEEFRRFQELNAAYKQKFGFPFILAVSGRNRTEILDNFEARLSNPPATEFDEALRQISRIAAIRLEHLAGY